MKTRSALRHVVSRVGADGGRLGPPLRSSKRRVSAHALRARGLARPRRGGYGLRRRCGHSQTATACAAYA